MSALLTAETITKCLGDYSLFRSREEVDETCVRVGEIFRPHDLKVEGKGQRLNANMDHLALKNVTINRLRYCAEVSIRSEILGDFFLIMLPLKATAIVRCGRHEIVSSPSLASVVSATSNLVMRWDEDCDQFIIRISRGALERTCEAFLGHPLNRPIEFSPGLDLRSEKASMWEEAGALIAANSSFASTAAKHPLIAAQAEQLLISTLLTGHQHQYREEMDCPSLVVAPHFVRSAEEFIVARAAEAITIRDVAFHTGVSVRSLHAGFSRYRRTSPKAFLRNTRLELVRSDLIAARDERRHETVTRVALSRGFSHLGHFTQAYKDKFGELPSETLSGRY